MPQDNWGDEEKERPAKKPLLTIKDKNHPERSGVTNPTGSFDRYEDFVLKLRNAMTAAKVDVSKVPDEKLITDFRAKLSPEGQSTFDMRYALDRPAVPTADPIPQSTDPKINPSPTGDAAKQFMTQHRRANPQGFVENVTENARDLISPLTNAPTLAGQQFAKTLGVDQIPREFRDPFSTAVQYGVPGFGQLAKPFISPELTGEEMSAQTSPAGLLGSVTPLRMAGVGSRALGPALTAADRIGAGLQVAGGAGMAAGSDTRGGQLQGGLTALMGIPGLLPQGRPQPTAAPSPRPSAEGSEFFGGKRLETGPEYFGGDSLALPPRMPPPQLEGPMAQQSLPGFNPRYQTSMPQEPPQLPPQGPLPGQGNLFPSQDFPRPIGPPRPQPADGEVMGSFAPQRTGQQNLFEDIQGPQMPPVSPDTPVPFVPPPPGLNQQPALFPNAPLPNFGGRNWRFGDTGELVHPPVGPQPLPKAPPPGRGGAKKTLQVRNFERGEATGQLIADFGGSAVGGVAGGLIGGATADDDDKIKGVLTGIALGMGAGHLATMPLRGAAKEAQDKVLNDMANMSPEAIKHRFKGYTKEAIKTADKAGDTKARQDAISNWVTQIDDPYERNRLYAQLQTPEGANDVWRAMNSIAKGNLLSSGTALATQLFNFPNLALRAGIEDPIRTLVSSIRGNKTDSTKAIFNPSGGSLKEVSPYYSAIWAGNVAGLKDAVHTIRTGMTDEAVGNISGPKPFMGEASSQMDFPHVEVHKTDVSPMSKLYALPADMTHRLVNALDVWPRAIARSMSESMAAVTQTMAEAEARGLKGKALNSYVAKNYGKTLITPDAKQEAGRRALETVMQEKPDIATQQLIKLKGLIPAFDSAIMFVKSANNAARQMLERVPVLGAGVHYSYHKTKNLGQGPVEPYTANLQNEMIAKQVVGLGALMSIAAAEQSGLISITGEESRNVGQRIKEKNFKQPRSIAFNSPKTGKPLFSMSYEKAPGIAMLLSAYAASKEAATKGDEDAVIKGVLDVSSFMADATAIRTIRDQIDAFSGFSNAISEKQMIKQIKNFAARQVQTVIPAIGAQRSVFEKGLDNTVRKQPDGSMQEVFEGQLPWNYQDREPVLDWKGDRVTRPGNAAFRVLDANKTFIPPGGITREIQTRVGDQAVPGGLDVQKTLKVGPEGNKIEVSLSKKQEYQRRVQSGKRRVVKIKEVMASDEFLKATKKQRGEMIRKAQSDAQKEVNEEWRQKFLDKQ
jgi:hypothetical protein